jgi:glycosyltransferase involved in cell wall biosynthesis
MEHTRSGSKVGPRVSIGMPVYNGSAFLREALDGLLAQTFEDFELIIRDNASTDATEDICREYAARDPRVRYVRSDKNVGAAANYNHVVGLARGAYFRWAAHDDVCLPGFLQACLDRFEQPDGADLVVVQPGTRFIDDAGEDLGPDEQDLSCRSEDPAERFAHVLRTVWSANAVFGLIRTDVLRTTSLIGTYIASDHVLLAELALRGRLVMLEEPLFLRRIHDGASMRAARGKRDGIAWFGPRASVAARVLSPSTNVARELLRSVRRAPLSRSQRWRAAVKVGTVYTPRLLGITARRWKRILVTRLRRTEGEAQPVDVPVA